MCLYDNAGESFLAGSEDASALETTRHLSHSSALFFVFDPLQDPRFTDALEKVDPGAARRGLPNPVLHRQETILREASSRIRRFLGIKSDNKHKSPLVVIVGKYDAWWKLLPEARSIQWLKNSKSGKQPGAQDEGEPGISINAINRMSSQLRNLLANLCPEIVGTAEFFSEQVIFIPVSALGFSCGGQAGESGKPGLIRPMDIDPFQVELPLIWYLTRLRSKKDASDQGISDNELED